MSAASPRVEEAPASLIAVVSGKGGVGKSSLAANLAVAAARRGARTLLVDGDLGLANLDLLLGLVPDATLADFAAGRRTLDELLVPGPAGIRLLPAAAAREDLAALTSVELARLGGALRELARGYELVLVDAPAGIGPTVLALAAASARRLLVVTPTPASLADAYATLKVLRRRAGPAPVALLVNDARNAREAEATHDRLARLARRFLDLDPPLLGWIPRDRRLAEAEAHQRPVVEAFPSSAVARRLCALAGALLAEWPASGTPGAVS
ncbi:MAG TPA: P-loop NTPase [Myxococcota bacterium]